MGGRNGADGIVGESLMSIDMPTSTYSRERSSTVCRSANGNEIRQSRHHAWLPGRRRKRRHSADSRDNAFNRVSRSVALLNIQKICPAMKHILINFYRTPTRIIMKDDGYHQHNARMSARHGNVRPRSGAAVQTPAAHVQASVVCLRRDWV